MALGFRGMILALATTTVLIGATAARAGDDGAAPLWVGIGSIFGGLGINPWGNEEKTSIEYREHGKIVVPPKIELPPPSSGAATSAEAWPMNQETQRKKIEREAAKKEIAGQGDARLRYTHPFTPGAPVTVRATDQEGPAGSCANGKCETSSVLSNLNPLGWVGMNKSSSAKLGPEPDREWLTDPPKGYRAPAGQAAN
jgi:hypothetical protein